MSRAYQIRVATSITHHSRVDEGIEAKLELLDILGGNRNAELLAEELERRGWEVDQGVGRKEVDGVLIEVETTTGTVRLKVGSEDEVELTTEVSGRSYTETNQEMKERLTEEAEAILKARAESHDQTVRVELAEKLERALAEAHKELEQITNAVTRAALKERAAQMGEILDVAENVESGELTIRVKV
ncbi:MAG: hypothetical protein KTR31_19985 [Myxococcales bacterium]|nr:hypothetical protein [Myxococcales bacterium]